MKNRCWRFLSALVIAGILMAQSPLTAAVYTDKSVFTSPGVLESGYYLEQDFSEIPLNTATATPGTSGTSVTFSANGFSYQLVSSGGFVYRPSGTPLGTPEVQGYSATDTLTITFTAGTVTAVGGRFFMADSTGSSVFNDGTLTVNTTGGSFTTSASSSPSWFGGITTVNPITSLTFASSGVSGHYPTFAEFYVGTAVVPEAGGWVAAGFIALVVVGRLGSQVLKRRQAC